MGMPVLLIYSAATTKVREMIGWDMLYNDDNELRGID
jgi:hypothetical protein